MSGNVVPFVPATLEGQIRAWALQRGVSYDDMVMKLCFAGWEHLMQEREGFIRCTAQDALEIAQGSVPTALELLEGAARLIRTGEASGEREDGPEGPSAA